MADKPRSARKFYAVMAVAMALGLALNYFGFNAVKMLFWSAVINGLLAPPLILLVILLTSRQQSDGQARELAATQISRLGYLCRHDCGSGRNDLYILK